MPGCPKLATCFPHETFRISFRYRHFIIPIHTGEAAKVQRPKEAQLSQLESGQAQLGLVAQDCMYLTQLQQKQRQEGHRFKASMALDPHPHSRQTPWGQGCSVQAEVQHLPGNPLQSWMHLLLEGQCIVSLPFKILSPTLYSLLTLRSWSKQAETGAMHHRAANLPWATEHTEMLPCDSGWKYVQGRTHSHRHLHTPGPPGPF